VKATNGALGGSETPSAVSYVPLVGI